MSRCPDVIDQNPFVSSDPYAILPGLCGEPTQVTYDRHARLTRIRRGKNTWYYKYDKHNRLVQVRSGATVTRFTHDDESPPTVAVR